MMSLNRIKAVIYKQFIDTFKNSTILLQFILIPLLSILLTETILKHNLNLPNNFFVIMFSPMYISMCPSAVIAGIISEEREKGTLKILLLNNVKSMEYLLGVSFHIIIMSLIGVILLSIELDLNKIDLLKYYIIMALGIVPSILLGATIGILAKNQITANSLVSTIVIGISILPVLSMLNDKIRIVSKFFYNQQLYDFIFNITNLQIEIVNIIIYIINVLLLFGVFIISYKRRTLI